MEIANSVVESLTGCFSLFAHAPEAGTRRDDIELGLRGFPAGKYVVISRVIHGMRDQTSMYKDDG